MNCNPAPLFPELEDLGSASGFVDEIRAIVKTLPLFEGFNHQESAVFCSYMKCFGAPSRATILREGDYGNFMLLLLTGSVNVVKGTPGESKLVAQLGPSTFLGEMSLFDGQQRFASCITNEPTDFAILTRDSLNDILLDHPRLGNKLLLILVQMITSRLRETTKRMLPTVIGAAI